MKEMKKALIASLDEHPELLPLGTRDELLAYLKEEFKELDLSKRWNALPEPTEVLLPNPSNILMYYLRGTHEKPKTLFHKYSGGDYPDIDIDLEPEGRETLKRFLRDTFGTDNCMDVSTFGGVHVKSAIQDLARIEKIDPQEVYPITTSIVRNVNNDEENKLEWIVEHNPKVAGFLAAHPKIHDWVEKMQEVKRSVGQHASAFIISNRNLKEYIPVILGKNKEPLTGYPESSAVKALNELGLIKFDLLALDALTIVRETVELVEGNKNVKIDWDHIDLDDQKSYELLRRGFNTALFQADSNLGGMIIATILPTGFKDLVALNSLIRPSCLQAKAHETYRDHKQGKFDRKKYPVWKDLKGKISDFTYDLLDSTYGSVIFQEQTMAMLAEFCGITLDETNKMRKIIGIPASKKTKEHLEYIKKQQEKWMFFGGNKFGELLAAQWWETAVGSLSYGFNLSHSVAYSMTTFRQLYLKTHYPEEFFVALMRQTKAEEKSGRSDLMKYIIEAKQLGVSVESPDVNVSGKDLSYVGNSIYAGVGQIKGVGEVAVKSLLERRPYISFEDFLEKHKKGTDSGVNKTAINALIYTNAFRAFGNRETLLETYWRTLLPKKKKDDPIEVPKHFDILKKEKDHLTIVLSETNPIKLEYGFVPITKAVNAAKDKICKITGIVDNISWHTSKAGNAYAKVIVNDLENSAIVLVWGNKQKSAKKLTDGMMVSMTVKKLDGETFALIKLETTNIEKAEGNSHE